VDFGRPVIACFVAVYGAELGGGLCAEIDPLLMMRPPRGCCAFMILNASCVHKNAPVRFTSTTAFHCSGVMSSSAMGGPPVPALCNRRPGRPHASGVLANSGRTDRGSLTSVGTTSVFEPLDSPSPAV